MRGVTIGEGTPMLRFDDLRAKKSWLADLERQSLRRVAATAFLLLVVACASKPPAKDPPPPPAPSYLTVLDGGKLIPLDEPVIVTMKPFPTATYQKTKQVWATVAYQDVTSSLRLAGRISAQQSGDLITVVTFVDQAGTSGNMPVYVAEAKIARGARYKVVIDAAGVIKDYGVLYASPSPKDAKGYELHNPDISTWNLPRDGFHQDQVVARTAPYESSLPHSAYSGKMVVKGRGTYRGRAVVVFEESGSVVVNSNLYEVHGYRLLDVGTGIWIRMDMVATTEGQRYSRTSNFREETIEDIGI
jgi:hypothetical protein